MATNSKFPNCPHCQDTTPVSKSGIFVRKEDGLSIQRYLCRACGKRFSEATLKLCYRQKKRKLNKSILGLLTAGVTMRRSALLLKTTRKTIERKQTYLALVARTEHRQRLLNLGQQKVQAVQFDDLVTCEHTKMKPLTVTLAVANESSILPKRFIFAAVVGEIPASGHLARKSVQKYGPRKNQHPKNLRSLFQVLQMAVSPTALFESDEHKLYPKYIGRFFPQASHRAFLGGRGSIAGQGELKKKAFDPLFSINHTCAMLRANIQRLIRKTWSLTKRADRLQEHLDIYIHFHNTRLLNS